MCFSTTASFTAAAVLGVVGCASIKLISEKRLLPVAMIPLLFAFQQLVEGFIWLHSTGGDPSFAHIGKYLFLTVAILIWPIWMPFSFFMAETSPIRRALLGLMLLAGVALSGMMAREYLQSDDTVSVGIIGHSIQYQLPQHYSLFYYSIYLALTLLPPFISGLNFAWVFGTLTFIGLLTAQFFYDLAFISVWCFFAALVSISLYLVLRANCVETKTSYD